MSKTPVIGILGGIGSGKTTVSRLLASYGCRIIDVDCLVHKMLDKPQVSAAICKRFGVCVLNAAGGVDRGLLGQRVFDKPEDINFLNGLIHPLVLRECEDLIRQFRTASDVKAIVLDMPLLLEVGWGKKCDFLVFVECEHGKRIERTLKNGKMDEKQFKKREKFQISLDKKKKIAHYRINNNSDESDVAEQVAQLFSRITESE